MLGPLMVPPGGSAAPTGPPFPERIRLLSVSHALGSRDTDVIRLLGRPDAICRDDPLLWDDGMELWYYGRLLARWLPSDGKVLIDSEGRVVLTVGGRFGSPAPRVLHREELQTALASLASFERMCRQPGRGSVNSAGWDAGTAVRIHNELQALGHRKLRTVLREYYRLRSVMIQDLVFTELDGHMRLLVSLLYPDLHEEEAYRGGEVPLVVDGVPLLIPQSFESVGGSIGPVDISVEELRRVWAAGVLRPQRLEPSRSPLRIPEHVAALPRWGRWGARERDLVRIRVRAQILALLEPALEEAGLAPYVDPSDSETRRRTLDRHWSAATDSLSHRTLTWNERLGRYELLN